MTTLVVRCGSPGDSRSASRSGNTMEIPKRLIECLAKNEVRYEILHHTEAFSAQRIAEAEHVKAEHHAKVVMVRSGQ
jgi:hypothetical protein